MSASSLLRKLRENPEYAKEIAVKLAYQYGNINLPEGAQFKLLIKGVQENQVIDKFTVLGQQRVDDNSYLFVTKCEDTEYHVKLSGKMGDVKNVHHINFLVTHNPAVHQIEFYAHLYEDLNEKNLLRDFAKGFAGLM